MTARIGILGGSFDPPHTGHLLVAQDAVALLNLDRLLVVPTAQQPLKGAHSTPAVHRLAMTRRCFDGIDGIEVDPIEIERGGLSYMVDTAETVLGRSPGAELLLLIGSDVVSTLPRWHRVNQLMQLVQLVVLTREVESSDKAHGSGSDQRDSVFGYPVEYLKTRRVDISSTEIRARVRVGRSIRGFVPDSVAAYIASNGLYSESSRDSINAEYREGA